MPHFVVVLLGDIHTIRVSSRHDLHIAAYARLLLGRETTLKVLGIGFQIVQKTTHEMEVKIGAICAIESSVRILETEGRCNHWSHLESIGKGLWVSF